MKEMIQATPGKSEKTKDDGRSPNTKQERPKEERGPMEKNWLGHLFSWYFLSILYAGDEKENLQNDLLSSLFRFKV